MNMEHMAEEAMVREGGLTVQDAPDEREPLETRKARTKRESEMLLPLIRVQLGNTVLRDAYRAARIGKKWGENVEIATWIQGCLQPNAVKFFLKKAEELGFTKQYKENYGVDLTPDLYLQEIFQPSTWAVVRAAQRAIGLSNYRNYKQSSGFAYTVDNDARVTRQPFTGELAWKAPEMLHFSWRPAESKEDYLAPFELKWIQHPDDPEQQIQIKVYRKVGNVYHSLTELVDQDRELYKAVYDLTPDGEWTKEYDNELRPSEFMRLANSDCDLAASVAEERGIRLFCHIDEEGKKVTLWHGGRADGVPEREVKADVAEQDEVEAVAI